MRVEPLTLRTQAYDENSIVAFTGGFATVNNYQNAVEAAGGASAEGRPIPIYPGIYVQDFSRDTGSNSVLTGVDTSVYPLEFKAVLQGTPINSVADIAAGASATWDSSTGLEFTCFAEYDMFIKISSEGTIVFQ
jgi:hypothetical protein